MRKIPTLFLRDEADMRRLTRRVHPDARWVIDGEGTATRKYDGICVMLDEHGAWWARREVKPGKAAPAGYVPVATDEVTGKTMGWEPIEQSSFAKYWREVMNNFLIDQDDITCGTYELVGPKINGNPEQREAHELVLHGEAEMLLDAPRDHDGLAKLLTSDDFVYEGIVWHHPDGRMAKIKRRDFR